MGSCSDSVLPQPAVRIEAAGNVFKLLGVPSADALPGIAEACSPCLRCPEERLVLDLMELEIEDGLALSAAIGLLRDLLAQGKTVSIRACPQLLAHNLYRSAMTLAGYGLTLESVRWEEPYS